VINPQAQYQAAEFIKSLNFSAPVITAQNQASELIKSLKRHRTNDADEGSQSDLSEETRNCEIKFLKNFDVKMDNNGYNKLITYIEVDMKVIDSLVRKNVHDMARWVRSNSVEEVYQIISNIKSDVAAIKNEGFNYCKHNLECRYKECCAGIHDPHMRSLMTSFQYVQYSTNRLIERNTVHHTSSLMRNLILLEINLWNMLSRRRFGKRN
jgi:hypothetical protein